jgi:hypothetical protein
MKYIASLHHGLIAVLALITTDVDAWNREGHQVVASLAGSLNVA